MRRVFPFSVRLAATSENLRRYWLGRDESVRVFSRGTLFVLAVSLVWFLVAYTLNDSPSWTAGGRPGWLAWWDQGQYQKQADELAHGELKPNVYWVGYPALGAIFTRVMPRHAFLIPDLVMVLAMVAVFHAAARLFVSRLEAVAVLGVFIWFDPYLRNECLVVPWNTLPTYTAIFISIYVLVLRPRRPEVSDFVWCGIMAGLAVLARPTEVAPLGLVFLPALVRLESWRRRAWAAVSLVLIVAGSASILILLNEHLYHTLKSPYMSAESEKLQVANYGLKAYQFFADSLFLTGNGALPAGTRPPSLLSRYPEFLFILPGLFFVLRTRGWAALGLILPIVFSIGFYLLYVPFDNPPYAWSYGQWHYLAWIFPWLGLVTYLSFRRAREVLPRGVFFCILLLPLLATCLIGFQAVPVASATPSSGNGLQLTTRFAAGSYAIQLRLLEDCEAEQACLVFNRPPPFYGTEVSTRQRVAITVNGNEQQDMIDCMISQENATYHVSFLAHGLTLHAGDLIEIRFQVDAPPELARADLDAICFAPLQAWRDDLSR